MKVIGGEYTGGAAVGENGGSHSSDQALSRSSGAGQVSCAPGSGRAPLFIAPRSETPTARTRPAKALWRGGDEIVGSSLAISRVRELIALYAPESDPVLINGETGVGKEAVARQIHQQGPRKQQPFIVRNVGRIDRDLAGADFFGHARGAFTGAGERRIGLFEQAHLGSLHLDEIGELPIELQANLLRVVEDGVVTPLGPSTPVKVDVRLIAATNVDLQGASANGAFRKDLFYRIAALVIEIPPLRERDDDAVEIAIHYVRQLSGERGVSLSLSQRALDAIRTNAWPGNVRELRNALRRAAIHVGDGVIDAEDLVLAKPRSGGALPRLKEANELLARYLAACALDEAEGVVQSAARTLDINREKCGEISRWISMEGATASQLREELRRLLAL